MNLWNSTFRKSTPLKRTKALAHKAAIKSGQKRLRSKQRPVSPEEKALWSRMAEFGCIACFLDGVFNDSVSIHHIDGRTKPDCHKKVLPVCAGHHQDGTGNDKSMIAIHPYKAAFELKYGNQYALLRTVMELIGE